MIKHKCIAASLLFLLPSFAFAQVTGVTVTGTSVNVQTLSTGTVLSVTPAVSPDLRYVGMSINPQFSVLDGVDTFILSNTTSAAAAGGIMPNGQPQAVAMRRIPFRPAQVGNVVLVENDKPLLATAVKADAWKDISLKDAVRKLSDVSHKNMVLGIRGLEQAGISATEKHDFKIPAGTVKDALLAILQTAVPENDMVIDATDNVITISTQAQADQVLITKTYYLEDLMARIPRIVAGGTDLNQIGQNPGPMSGLEIAAADKRHSMDLSRPPVTPPAAKPKPKTHSDSTNILELLTDTVRPEVWVNHGGKAEAYAVGNKVTIKAPASIHALLDGPKVYNPNKIDSYINYAP
jgi:hypothetical protein